MKNIKPWIVIALIVLVLLSQREGEKKEAGGYIQFRTGSPSYGLGSEIAYSDACDGTVLTRYSTSATSNAQSTCSAYLNEGILISGIPHSSTTAYWGLRNGDYYVCWQDAADIQYRKYTLDVDATVDNSPTSIDSKYEVDCPCTPYTCIDLGYECGSHSDGCEGTLDCGDCDILYPGEGRTCNAGTCILPCIPNCTGLDCGPDPVCGTSCGTCTEHPNSYCNAGICDCTINCTGKICGDDSCGGTCGTCSAGYTCEAGNCVVLCPVTLKDCNLDLAKFLTIREYWKNT